MLARHDGCGLEQTAQPAPPRWISPLWPTPRFPHPRMAWIYNGALIAPGTGMDSFNLMRAFRRIVERGGLARAAEDLGMSPAGLSKQLRALETHLGVVLLQRTTRRMSLTETGHAYYRECCRLLDELDALERGIAEQRGEVAGRLRVNADRKSVV